MQSGKLRVSAGAESNLSFNVSQISIIDSEAIMDALDIHDDMKASGQSMDTNVDKLRLESSSGD